MSIAYEQKAPDGLNKLGLKIAAEHLDSVGQRAAAESWSYSHFLGYLLEGELTKRHRKTVEFNLQLSHLPYIKKLEDFDFAAQPTIDRRLIDELATGRFLSARPKHCFSRTSRSWQNTFSNFTCVDHRRTWLSNLLHHCH